MNKRVWLKSEEKYLIENYPHKSASAIALHLNRTVGAVQQRSFVLGVFAKNRSGVKTNWTKKKVLFLQNNFREMTTKEICNCLKITDTVVRMKMKELGIRKYLKNEKCYA